jgi:hypothetical protein
MTRALFAVGAALTVMIAGLALAVFVARDEDNLGVDNVLAEDFTRAVALAEERTGGRVDLRRLAPFAWDEVLVVARGTSPDELSRRLGRDWPGDLRLHTGELLVFLEGGRVVRYADYRGSGRFEGFTRPFDSLPRSRAVLRVRDLVIRPA